MIRLTINFKLSWAFTPEQLTIIMGNYYISTRFSTVFRDFWIQFWRGPIAVYTEMTFDIKRFIVRWEILKYCPISRSGAFLAEYYYVQFNVSCHLWNVNLLPGSSHLLDLFVIIEYHRYTTLAGPWVAKIGQHMLSMVGFKPLVQSKLGEWPRK